MGLSRLVGLFLSGLLSTGSGALLWKGAAQIAPGVVPTTENGLLSVALLVAAIGGMATALGFMYREQHKSSTDSTTRLNTAHNDQVLGMRDAHISQITSMETLYGELLKAKDETIEAKDKVIAFHETRSEVMDQRLVDQGRESQSVGEHWREALSGNTAALASQTAAIERLTENIGQMEARGAHDHSQMVVALRSIMPPDENGTRQKRRTAAMKALEGGTVPQR